MRQILPIEAGCRQISVPDRGQPGGDGLAALASLYAYPAAGPARRAWVRANMVASVDGAASLDGRSGGLSGRADRAVFAVLRSLADVIVVGASTARIERYQPVRTEEIWPELRAGRSPTPTVAVITRRMFGLDPDGPLLDAGPGQARTIIFTTEAAPQALRVAASARAEVIVAGRDLVSPEAVVSALAERGHRRVLTEGGPHLLEQLVTAGLLDELCLTVSPVLAAGQARRILAAPPDDPASGGATMTRAAGTAAPAWSAATGTATARARGPERPAPPVHPDPTGLRLAHLLADEDQLLCRYLRADN